MMSRTVLALALTMFAAAPLIATAFPTDGPGAPEHAEAPHDKAHAEKQERDMSALFPQPKANTALSQRPDKPELSAPAFYEKIADKKVTLKWKEVAGTSIYHVQVATDPNFKWLVKEENMLKGTSLDVTELEAGKSYFWRVAGLKPENKASHTQGMFASSMFETAK